MACSPQSSEKSNPSPQNANPSTDFNRYWFQNKAEISTFELQQGQFGEQHSGSVQLIYVVEPFLREKQVKPDSPASNPNGTLNVLKLNTTRNFVSGLNQTSMMMSVFTPLNTAWDPFTLKTNFSVQNWCGQVFGQLNLNPSQNVYDYTLNSFYEKDGDRKTQIERAFLEDEVWTRLRIQPKSLPVGKIRMIPAQFTSHLMHQDLAVMDAEAELVTNPPQNTYKITYPHLNRTLEIRFQSKFPYAINSWKETFPAFDGSQTMLTTTARRVATLKSAFWQFNKNKDRAQRKSLRLKPDA